MQCDALLVLSFGGPEGPDDVLPFLRNVTAGRNVPDERLVEVAKQYELFGGISPINAQNRALIAAVEQDLAFHGLDLPVYFGNRNWAPYLNDTVAQMAADGVRSAHVFVTSAFGSYSGCRQYRENMAAAVEAVGDSAPQLHKLRLYYNHPGFLEAVIDRVAEVHAAGEPLVFTAHSIPESMASSCDYEAQLTEAAGLVAAASDSPWTFAFQSRSGPPHIPWLEPDIVAHLEALAKDGVTDLTVVPLGFVSDHMEVMFDLDTQAADAAKRAGINMRRAPTVGTHPRFTRMVTQLILEQQDGPVLWLGDSGPWPDPCPPDHCMAARRPS